MVNYHTKTIEEKIANGIDNELTFYEVLTILTYVMHDMPPSSLIGLISKVIISIKPDVEFSDTINYAIYNLFYSNSLNPKLIEGCKNKQISETLENILFNKSSGMSVSDEYLKNNYNTMIEQYLNNDKWMIRHLCSSNIKRLIQLECISDENKTQIFKLYCNKSFYHLLSFGEEFVNFLLLTRYKKYVTPILNDGSGVGLLDEDGEYWLNILKLGLTNGI